MKNILVVFILLTLTGCATKHYGKELPKQAVWESHEEYFAAMEREGWF